MATRWLFKTEPSVYSYQQLVKDKQTMWDGVANNLALKNVKDIKKGDQIFIYHTGGFAEAGDARGSEGASKVEELRLGAQFAPVDHEGDRRAMGDHGRNGEE
jgi:hypothetical protein